jgi:GH25 family lysozyme M1 (1,4-beta-N-acetylmuramidase)
MKKIIDISHHHPVKSWDSLQKDVEFLITKATEGTSYVDPTLKTIIKECEKRKIPYWLYTFLRDGNEPAQSEF